MISHTKKFIFIHIPKTGGSSIEYALKNEITEKIIFDGKNTKVFGELNNPIRNSFNSLKHGTATELKRQYKDNFNSYYKFSVIRNPWDRLLSLYQWVNKCEYDKSKFLKFLPQKIQNNNIDSTNKRSFWSLNKYLCDENDRLIVDYLISFDDIENGFYEINKKLNMNYKLDKINKSNLKLLYKDVMDDEVKKIIENYYKKEIDKFWK